MVAAGDAFDAADDRIVEDAAPGTLVITADCRSRGAPSKRAPPS
jgi:uncharacterized protein YaiI (UPF0178 family)